MSNISLALVPKNDFKAVATPPGPKEIATPFSIRLTPSEKAYLTKKAGSRPLGAYIRQEILGDQTHSRRKERKPKVDEKQVAALLAELGQSRIPSNLTNWLKPPIQAPWEFLRRLNGNYRMPVGPCLRCVRRCLLPWGCGRGRSDDPGRQYAGWGQESGDAPHERRKRPCHRP